jgi:hypothetical protein
VALMQARTTSRLERYLGRRSRHQSEREWYIALVKDNDVATFTRESIAEYRD